MDKQSLRQRLKKRRLGLSDQEVAKLSAKILANFLVALDLSSIHSLHIYLPIKSLNEVDTEPLLHFIWENYPNIKTATWEGQGQDSRAVWINQKAQTQPVPANFQFDIVVVPLLGFDKYNHRLGFGGGFYDHFLSGQHNAIKVGLAYQLSLVENRLPVEPHDVTLNMVITEKKAYKF